MDDNARLLQEFQAFLAQRKSAQAPKHQDFEATIAEWRLSLVAGGREESTAGFYVDKLRTIRGKWGLDVMRMEPLAVTRWGAEMPKRLGAGTLAGMYSALRLWAEFTGQTEAVKGLRSPTKDPTPKPLPPARDVEALRDAMRPSKHSHSRMSNTRRRDGAMFDLLFECAMRASEVIKLDIGDLRVADPRGGHAVWSPKTGEGVTHVWVERSKRGKSRLVPLTPQASRSLTNYVRLHRIVSKVPEDADAVFHCSRGRMTYKGFRTQLVRYGKALGITSVGGKTHTGRRVVITTLIKNRAIPSAIIRVTGHKSERELQPYILHDTETAEREFLERRKKTK